ncbi:MAG: adenylosuccinate synthase [Planctomycetota bacterium]|nr:adenylosuccinate synthase [Planctomycetota bacterium]
MNPTHAAHESPPPTAPARPIGRAAAVVGLQWGDEGKGKVIDLLAGSFDAVVRYNGGANAGHSVVIEGRRHALHLIPSGVFHPRVKGVIGNGVVIDPESLVREIEGVVAAGVGALDLAISDRAHVVMPYHKLEDAAREAALAAQHGPASAIGTTKRGIGPAYADKATRATAVRMGDLLRPALLRDKLARILPAKAAVLRALAPDAPVDLDAERLATDALRLGEKLAPRITDTTYLLHDMLARGGSLLFEGANATLLDVDHGTFPYVTSSNCSVLGIPAGTGVPGSHLSRVIGVMKAYCTRVGGGPFPTELLDERGNRIRERGREYGTTTGRPRRCGWLDLVALRYAVMLNGVTSIALMLLDVLAGFDEICVCTGYRIDGRVTDRFVPDAEVLAHVQPVYERLPGFASEIGSARARADLPRQALDYVRFIEQATGVPVEIVSVGPDRAQTIKGA